MSRDWNPYRHAGQVRRLQDDQNARPSETPEYAIATLATTTSVANMMEHQLQLVDAQTNDNYHEPRNKQPTPIEETEAWAIYVEQMAALGKEVKRYDRSN